MSVRGVWVIKPEEEEVLFSKRFPTVEVRFKRSSGPSLYHPLPPDTELASEVNVRCSSSFTEFVRERDSVQIPNQWPVLELLDGKIWPVVCLKKNGLLFVAAVPYEPDGGRRPSLIKIPGIPAAIALLTAMVDILGPDTSDLMPSSSSSPITELSQFLCVSAPFGTPSDTNPANIKLQLQFRKSTVIPKDKVPSWRPAVYKGASKINLVLKEQIRAIQYDRPDIPNISQVYGSVTCKAELEGHPDVIISLTTPPGSSPLDHLVVHPCVQSADSDPVSPGGAIAHDGTHTRKIRFSPPLDNFTLCHYESQSTNVPVRGFYQMKGDKVVELLVQLKLMENVRNSFEFLEVHIPFFNRGPIEKIDNIRPTNSNLSLSEAKHTLIWNIGQRFPPKSLETSLGATVTFVEFPPEDPRSPSSQKEESIEEKFCVEQNAFCEIHFKTLDYTLSGCNIDHRAMTLLPPIKFKSSLVREFASSEYKVWNSHGDVLGMPFLNDFTDLSSSQSV